jgi:pimeloyl-ACP methyl ester carboxylesterase
MNPVLAVSAVAGACLAGPLVLAPLRERLTPRQFAGDDCYVRVGPYEVHYTDEGPRDGRPVQLLHGFSAWGFTWRALRRTLASAGCRVITVDQPGYGASDRPEALVYSTFDQAQVHLAVLDALGVRSAHLVGHSFGGRVAMQIAIVAPERVRSLVCVCPEAFATGRPPIGDVVALPVLGYALAYYVLSPALVRPGLRFLSGSSAWLTDEVVAGYSAPLEVKGTIAAQVWQARSPKDGRLPVPENLAGIRQSMLLLWGEADPVFPASDGQRLASILPNARLRVLAGIGHLPHEESEPEVTRTIAGFIEGMRT